MALTSFQRLTSNTTTVFLGASRSQAAENAANATGSSPGTVPRFPTWESIEKFDNDTTTQPYSPFGGVANPDYIWDPPVFPAQTRSFAIASNPIVLTETTAFTLSLVAFCDNAMEAQIELFQLVGMDYVKVIPQPAALGDVLFIAGDPNNPATGITEAQPFNWQDVRVYSTQTSIPPGNFKIVLSFEATNYLPTNNDPSNPDPAGLQFILDIYREAQFLYATNDLNDSVEIFDITNPTTPVALGTFNGGNLSDPIDMEIRGITLYVTNQGSNSVEIYDISNPISPVRVSEFNSGNLNQPQGLAITGTTLYVANFGDSTVEIYSISNPISPVRIGQFNGGNLSNPIGLAITGTTLYVVNAIGAGYVSIYGISNPAVPVFLSNFGMGMTFPHFATVYGDLLYVSRDGIGTQGISIFNISTPTAPVFVPPDFATTENNPYGLATIENILYVADPGGPSIVVFDISLPTTPVSLGSVPSIRPLGLVIVK